MTAALSDFSAPRARASEAPRVILGAMNFGARTPEAEAHRIIDRALDGGVAMIDTANAYVDGESERIVGRALRGRRDRALVATKVGLTSIGGKTSGLMRVGGRAEGLSRARILAACDESLERLGMDHVDVYYLHAPDAGTPIEESLSAIAELLRAGKIRAWATSNYASWQMLEMLLWCEREGVARPLFVQLLYNLLVRQLDVEYFAFARKVALATAIYNPLAGGLLAARPGSSEPRAGSRFDANPMYQRRYWSDRFREQVTDYGSLAESIGMTPVALAYAWLASRADVAAILVGPGTTAHLDDALGACARRLTPETLTAIDDLHRAHQGTDAVYARP